MQVLKERTTRLVLAARRAGTSAAETVAVMMAVFRRLDPRRHASVTLDNGTAFTQHGLLASASCSGTGRPGSSPLLSRPERRGGQTTLTVNPESKEPLETFTIVTTTANELMRPIHERMPLILAPSDFDAWLSSGEAPTELLPGR